MLHEKEAENDRNAGPPKKGACQGKRQTIYLEALTVTKYLMQVLALSPLLVVAVLTATGRTFYLWVYVILAIVCPLVAGFLWFTYRNMERRTKDAERERLKSRK